MADRHLTTEEKYHNVARIVLMVLSVAAILVGVLTKSDSILVRRSTGVTLTDVWVDYETKEPIRVSELKIDSGKSIIMETTLPENLGSNAAIGYFDQGFLAKAYIEGNRIFSSGDSYYKKIGKEQGSIWRIIKLSSEMSGKNMVLALQNDTGNALYVDFKRIYLGAESDIAAILIDTSIPGVSILAFCLISFFFLFAFSFALKEVGYVNLQKRAFYLGFIALSLGVWVFTDGNMLQVSVGNPSVRYILSFVAMAFIPVFVNLYYSYALKDEKGIMMVVLNIYEFCESIALLLYIVGLVHITNTLFVPHVFLLLDLVLILDIGIRGYIKERSKEALGQIFSGLLVVILIVVGLVLYYLRMKTKTTVMVGFGFIIYMIITFVTQVRAMVLRYRSRITENEVKALSSVDNVTRGNSRYVLSEWLSRDELFKKGAPWFVHMDLVDFSSVNVSLGWEKGNEILKGIYETNLKAISSDEIEGSIGDSDFAFVLNPRHDVEDFCKEILTNLEEYMRENWKGTLLSAKFSVVLLKRGDNLDSVIDHCHMAYISPLAGFNKDVACYYYNADCEKQIRDQAILEGRIEHALDNNEFVMYLQPKVSPAKCEVIGAEALIRWNSKTEGLISPGLFIPAAEKSGQVRKLDLCIFELVCKYLVERKEKGLKDIKISVNVSKNDIGKPNFFEPYERIIRATNVPCENLEFEFTESTAFADINAIERLIARIHGMGAHVSMDDFGSSYSNLGAIARLKFDVVKMDKLFFDAGFPVSERDYTLVEGVIRVFHNMGIKIVCEGIETEEQNAALTELNADAIQGYYYAKPMPAAEFEEYENNINK